MGDEKFSRMNKFQEIYFYACIMQENGKIKKNIFFSFPFGTEIDSIRFNLKINFLLKSLSQFKTRSRGKLK